MTNTTIPPCPVCGDQVPTVDSDDLDRCEKCSPQHPGPPMTIPAGASERRREALRFGTCPSCHTVGALTRFEAARGYQCSACVRREEGYGI